MIFSVYIILLTILSFIGFVIDTTYNSLEKGRFIKSGYIPYLPLCPVYGIGGLVLFLFQKHLGYMPLVFLILLGAFLAILTEYFGGVFCTTVLKERLWDYSKLPWNLHGHISLLFGFYWILVVFVFVKYLFPIFLRLENYLLDNIKLGDMGETIFLGFSLFLFVLIAYIEFDKRRKKRKKNPQV